MGRYYSGDINGKFAVGSQSSCDGEQFGMTEESPNTIRYYSEDLEQAKEGVKRLLALLGDNYQRIASYFETDGRNMYSDAGVIQYFMDTYGISLSHTDCILYERTYFSIELGNKIVDCIREHGSCTYEADI